MRFKKIHFSSQPKESFVGELLTGYKQISLRLPTFLKTIQVEKKITKLKKPSFEGFSQIGCSWFQK